MTSHRAHFLIIYLLVSITLIIASCNLPVANDSPASDSPVIYKVRNTGSDIQSPDGVRVVVPKGSLKSDTELSLAVSSEEPPAPQGSTPIGKTYEISLSNGAELLFPLEVYLPLERKRGAHDSQYVAMRWDGVNWTSLPGQVQGNFYRFTTEHNTLYRLNYFEAANYPIQFYNYSGTQVRVWAYTYETFHDVGKVGYTYMANRDPGGVTSGMFSVPVGVYNQWCAEWPEFTTPVWDIFGGGYWSDFIGNFHYIFSAPVLINRYSEIEANQPNTAKVTFSIGGRNPGLCPQAGMVRTVNPNNPLREQPMPWTVLEPTRNTPLPTSTVSTSTSVPTATLARTNTLVATSTPLRSVTPLSSVTPIRSATPLRTATSTRTATPQRTATSTLNIGNYVVSSQHIDRQDPLLITLAHDQDYVTLRGPITINYVYYHRPSAGATLIIDPPVKYVIKRGENRRFELDDLYGLNDIYLYLVSSP
jgi:hypothetical protein